MLGGINIVRSEITAAVALNKLFSNEIGHVAPSWSPLRSIPEAAIIKALLKQLNTALL